jgi:hypothetical protein
MNTKNDNPTMHLTLPLTQPIVETQTRIRQLTFSVGFVSPIGGVRLRDLSEPEKGARAALVKELSAAKQRLSDLLTVHRARN